MEHMAANRVARPDLAPVYNPEQVEEKWYRFWEERRFFHAEVDPGREPFSIVIPPPNVTGNLHLGHALNNTIQDVFIRWRRMQGYSAMWMPGTDHAGIATQHVVEKRLAEDGLSRYDLGREQFLEKVWEWKDTYEQNIIDQLKRIGSSCDWDRTRFTMDEGCSRAVREVFVSLYEQGLIYRDHYIINWCPDCHTALSDIEVEHEEAAGKLYHVRYPFVDGSGHITVATTRPETILGDTAVAVHPDDDRYRAAVGKKVVLPVIGREIPIISDDFVDPEFGSGAVKVTPAHDPTDFEVGLRHDLPRVQVINDDARMTGEAGPYAGLDRYECRRRLLEDLESEGLLEAVEEHSHAVGHCYRCDSVVEPLISRQWFVRMKPLAGPAIEAVVNGETRFIPRRFEKIYLNWLEGVRDWCISRQIWWGHRIPAWYCHDCGETIVSRDDPTICPSCRSAALEQDADVLDTWFSSALWPFSTMGWPEDTAEMNYFFPTTVLVTAYDIIFFWVARMMFSSLRFTGQVPFREVLITGLVRDALGRKMSKSLGNGIDPLEIVDRYGADTLRLSLVMGNAPGNDLRFSWKKAEGSRNFCNKLWNAARFMLMHLDGFEPDDGRPRLTLADRWIRARCNRVVSEVTRHLEKYDLGEAVHELHQFIWGELCDWYLEMTKPRLYGDDPEGRRAARETLLQVFDRTLRVLHPFAPFITEEIWQHLPGHGESLMTAEWPRATQDWDDPEAELQGEIVMETIKAIRSLRSEVGVEPRQQVRVVLRAGPEMLAALAQSQREITELASVSTLELSDADFPRPRRAITTVVKGVEVFLPLEDLVDLEREIARLESVLAEARSELERSRAKVANPGFINKAPAEVVDRERSRKAELEVKVNKIKERIEQLQA